MFTNNAFAERFSLSPLETVARDMNLNLMDLAGYTAAQRVLDDRANAERNRREAASKTRLERIKTFSLQPQVDDAHPIHKEIDEARFNYKRVILEPVIYGSRLY